MNKNFKSKQKHSLKSLRLKMLITQLVWFLLLSLQTFQKLKENCEQSNLNPTTNLKLKFFTTRHFVLKMLQWDQIERKLF